MQDLQTNMNIKIGTDICSTQRVARVYSRFGDKFLGRILTEAEKQYVISQPLHLIGRLAGRFAAKEAASKALGTGWHGIGFKDVEIIKEHSGAPGLVLHGRARAVAEKLKLTHFEISLSHEKEYATACVLAYNPLPDGNMK